MRAAQQEANALSADDALLSKEFDLSLGGGMYTAAQLLECAAVLEESSFWQRVFGRDYRGAAKSYRRIVLDPKKSQRAQMIHGLRKVAEQTQKRAQFDNHATYREILGVHFSGVNSPWVELLEVLQWYEEIFIALPEHQLRADPSAASCSRQGPSA